MKTKLIMFLVIVFLTTVVVGAIWLTDNSIKMEFAIEGKAVFIYDSINISHKLSNEELSLVKDIFNKKKLYKDNPSCGFSENISIKFNDSQTFCIARDTCPIVYWKEKNQYIKLTEEEKMQLYDLLEQYGFFFPCV